MNQSPIGWSETITKAAAGISDELIAQAAKVLFEARLVLTAGNGGSAALASHAAQAILKPNYQAGGGRGAVALSDNIATLTAHANDGGWETALIECARPFFDYLPGIALLLISSSGRSKNVCLLAEHAKKWNIPIVALTGFDGEPLRSIATVALHVNSHDYEVVEPVHDAILHRIQRYLRTMAVQGDS